MFVLLTGGGGFATGGRGFATGGGGFAAGDGGRLEVYYLAKARLETLSSLRKRVSTCLLRHYRA